MGAQLEEVKRHMHEISAARVISEAELLQKFEQSKVVVAQKLESYHADVLQKVDASLSNLGQQVKSTCD